MALGVDASLTHGPAVAGHSMGRIGPIDSLRCFAMTAVVAQHCGLLPFGWTGVWLFFVISGYVVTLSVVSRWQQDRSGWSGILHFYRRRAQRIFPVYYLYLITGILVATGMGYAMDPIAILSLLGFVNNVAMIAGKGEFDGWSLGHLWSISVEMQFYLIYGFALFLCSRRTILLMLAAALVLAPIMRTGASLWLYRGGWDPGSAAYAIYAGPLLHFDAFAAGGLLAFAAQAGLARRWSRHLAVTGFGILGSYCAVYVAVNQAVLGETGIDVLRNVLSGVLYGQGREIVLYTALVAASTGLVALAAHEDRWVAWLLRHSALQRIGAVSYGAYLYHGLAIMLVLAATAPVPDAAMDLSERLMLFALVYPATIAAAEVSFRCLERPFRVRRRSTA